MESNPGPGTIFIIGLPVKRGQLGKTVLSIDDEKAIWQSFTDALEDMDYRILTAENGRAGMG